MDHSPDWRCFYKWKIANRDVVIFAVIQHDQTQCAGHMQETKYTPTQGQYLAFIHSYCTLNRKSPAESDFVNYFRVSPPTVHSMIVRLHDLGFIERTPHVPRSIRLLISPDKLPPLDS